MRFSRLALLVVVSSVFSTAEVSAQVLFSSELDSATGWTIVADEDTAYEFGFDYSTLGIPKNPNSSADSTTGLRMAANIVDPGAPAVISATPDGFSASGRYRVEADVWLNYNTSGGTTEFIGGFIGFDPDGSPVNGIGILGDSDGDSARDYRIYNDSEIQEKARDNGEEAISTAFPGQTTPAAQGDGNLFDPTNTVVTAPNGTLGFGWHTLAIDVDSTTGMVDLSFDDFLFGTVDSSDDPSALEGAIAVSFADLFNSVATKPEFAFGVVDNVTVTQVPEPSGVWLASLGLLGIGAIRRRR